MSGLGEPLNAEIEVLSASPDELAELSAGIASEEAYAVQGLERPGFHKQIKVTVGKKSNGTPVLRLTTNAPVTDPFLDMLVQVDWSTGRLIREFTLLLDPPDYSSSVKPPALNGNGAPGGNAASPVVPNSSKSPGNAAASRNAAASPLAVKPSRKGKQPNSNTSPDSAGAASSGTNSTAEGAVGAGPVVTTQKGDTLINIARQAQVEGVNLDQMMIGIYRTNKQAFSGDNINRLKVGQIVRVPSAEELQAVKPREASQEVKLQTADWQAYRNKLAANAQSAPAAKETGAGNAQSSSGKLTASAKDNSQPESKVARDVVKLSKSDAANTKPGDANTKQMQEKLSALQEEAIAREKSVKEANDRATALEKQIQDMQKLLVLKNQAMANMQKNAAQQAASDAEKKPAPLAGAEVAANAKQTAPESTAEKTPPPVETEKPSPAPAPVPASEQAKPAVVAPIAAAPTEEPSFLDSLLQDPLPLALLALLVLLLGGWLYLRSKRKRGLDGFEKSILTSGGLNPSTVFGNTLGDSIHTGDTSFLTDFSQSSGGMIDTNDVDPIAEAEVYMAYGRDKQAEEILRHAITKEPNRYELHLKLLELYAGRNDISAFEATAGELYTSLGAQHPVWAKVAQLGRQLEPDNPLYASVTPVSEESPSRSGAATAALSAAALGIAGDKLYEEETGDEVLVAQPSYSYQAADAAAATQADAGAGLNFDLGKAQPNSDFKQSIPAVEESLDEFGGDGFAEAEALPEAIDTRLAEEAAPAIDNVMEFDLAEPAAKASQPVSSPIASASQVESGAGLDFPSLMSAPEKAAKENLASEAEFVIAPSAAAASAPEIAFEEPDIALPDLQMPASATLDYLTAAKAAPNALSAEPELPEISFELPASSTQAEPQAATSDAGLPDLNLAELNLPELNLPDFDLPKSAGDSPVASPDLADELSFAPDALSTFEQETAGLDTAARSKTDFSEEIEPAEDIVFEAIPENDIDMDFDVDLDDIAEDAASSASAAESPALDFSGISLDLGETEAAADDLEFGGTVTAAESSEVDTKLDLVTAYIDMGDSEGAKELLDEVLQEGGPGQRSRAEEILKTLG